MGKRVVVLISGSGTNLQALIDAVEAGDLDAVVVGVVSNRKDAYGLERAKAAGILTAYFPLKPYRDAGESREVYDMALAKRVKAFEPDLIVLAGWMHILSPAFLSRFPGRVINLHPALPGQFPGATAIEQAYEAAQRGECDETGCMVHYVVPEIDAGPVIMTETIPIMPDETLDQLTQRMHDVEHRLIVAAVARALNDIG